MNLEEVFCPGGLLDRYLTDYEFRPSQLQMARAVDNAIQNQEHLLVEAGTGTGKTLAYLVPALIAEKRVMISTATKNLQDQLFSKDLPLIRKILFPRLKAVCLKGRQNYLCLKKFKESSPRTDSPETGDPDNLEMLSCWIRMTRTGDREELEWLADDDPWWKRLDARSDHCTGQKCPEFRNCFVTRIRQKAFESDILVVNHALFFSNLALENDEIGPILPDFAILILDEAHEVEDIAGPHFGRKLSSFQMIDLCRHLKNVLVSDTNILKEVDHLQSRSDRFFDAFPEPVGRHSLNFYRDHSEGVVDLRYQLFSEFDELNHCLKNLYRRIESLSQSDPDQEILLRRLDRILETMDEIFNLDESDYVYWFERSTRGVQVHATPVNLSGILGKRLFDRLDCVVLASATLTTGGNFDYIRNRLGIEDADEKIVQGEFDYANQSVLYVPRHTPPPSAANFGSALLKEILALLEITRGNAFVLFTSYRQMEHIYLRLSDQVDYPLFKQGDMPKNHLLDLFKATSGAVLCATSSFWQGVDVRGPALKLVVVDKLPFQVPTEPIVAARVGEIQQRGEDAFWRYLVPSAIISLKQGLGRLIRSRSDFGILAVLDSRIWSKSYGKQILKSLPNCPVTDNIKYLQNYFSKIVSNRVAGLSESEVDSENETKIL